MRKSKIQWRFGEVVRFLIVGGIATAADYAVYWLFTQLIFPPIFMIGNISMPSMIVAVSLGYWVGLMINWVLSVVFVFKDTVNYVRVKSAKEFFKFLVISLIGMLFTQLVMWLGMKFLPSFSLYGTEYFLMLSLREWVLRIFSTCVVLIFNYVARKKYIFKD